MGIDFINNVHNIHLAESFLGMLASESLQVFESERDDEAAHETSKHDLENPNPLGRLLIEK